MNTSTNSIRVRKSGLFAIRSANLHHAMQDKNSSEYQGSRGMQYFAALAANLSGLALGTVMSFPAVALPDLRNEGLIPMTDDTESWIGSIITLGAVIGPPVSLFATFGRRDIMLILTIPFLVGWLLIYFATGIKMILAGRFLTGVCSGIYCNVAVIFTAEISDTSVRGTLCAGFDMMISVGILFIYIVGSVVGWRTQALICAIIPVLIFIMTLFIPESPRYLVEKGDINGASTALIKYRGSFTKEEVDPELRALKVSVRHSQEKSGGWRDLFSKPVIRPVSIAFLIYFFQVASGIDPVLFYTVDIFASSGASIDEYASTIFLGGLQIVAALIGAISVEYFGRRLSLLLSEVSMTISLCVLGYYFHLKDKLGDIPPEGLGWVPLTSLVIYVCSYSIGLGPVGYMILGEILPHHVKGLAGCILTSLKWLMSFAMTKCFVDLISLIGNDGCYFLFGGFCLSGFVYIYFFVPETKGKTLDQIQREFSDTYMRKS